MKTSVEACSTEEIEPAAVDVLGATDVAAKLAAQLAVLSLGLVVAALLNFVPFLGWFVNVVLVVLGVGGMTLAIFERSRGTATPAAG